MADSVNAEITVYVNDNWDATVELWLGDGENDSSPDSFSGVSRRTSDEAELMVGRYQPSGEIAIRWSTALDVGKFTLHAIEHFGDISEEGEARVVVSEHGTKFDSATILTGESTPNDVADWILFRGEYEGQSWEGEFEDGSLRPVDVKQLRVEFGQAELTWSTVLKDMRDEPFARAEIKAQSLSPTQALALVSATACKSLKPLLSELETKVISLSTTTEKS